MNSAMSPIIFVAGVAALCLFVGLIVGRVLGIGRERRRWERELGTRIEQATKDALKRSRAVIGGQVSEQLAPYLPGFDYRPSECRFIGKPIDFLVFVGMDDKAIEEVVFVEVKSGQSGLSTQERRLRDAIQGGHVRWEEYRVPTQD